MTIKIHSDADEIPWSIQGKDECRSITLKVGRVSCNAYDEIEKKVRSNVGTINERHEDKECKEDGNGE